MRFFRPPTSVSVIDDNRPARESASKFTMSPSDQPPAKPASTRTKEDLDELSTPPAFGSKNGTSSDVNTGKWMVGIGLGIAFLVIIFVKSTNQDSDLASAASVAVARTTAIPAKQPPASSTEISMQQPAGALAQRRISATEFVNVLEQQIVFSNPSGYCTPGKSAREIELVDLARRSIGEGARLVHTAAPCLELEDYRTGRKDMLDHWLQIQLIGPKGNFQRIEVSREAFLSSLAKLSPRIDSAELNQRLKTSLERGDVTLSDMKLKPIGRDGNAVYFAIRMNVTAGETTRQVTGLSATTLLNFLPLSVNVYGTTDSAQSLGQLQSVQRELMHSLLTEN